MSSLWIPLAAETNPVSLDLWTLILQAASVLVILLVLYRFLFEPVGQIIEKRQKFVEDSLAHARSQREEAERLLAEYKEQIKDAESEARQIVQRAVQDAEEYSKRRRAEVEAEAERMIERAKEEIEAERRKALASIRNEVAALTIQVAERVIGREVKASDHSRLIDDMLKEIEGRQLKAGDFH